MRLLTKALNSNIIKKLCSGGDTLQGRIHGGLKTDFVPHFLTMILANDLPPIEPYDEPTQKRARVYFMTKPFVDEPSNEFELKKDYNLETEMKTIKFQKAFIQLLIELYAEFQSNGRIEVEPQEVLNAKTE